MLCKNCGADLGKDAKFCSNCGRKVEESAKEPETSRGTPLWFKIIVGLFALGLLLASLFLYLHEDVGAPVEGQLKAIQEDKITEAYYNYTSKEFQEATSLERFRDFVKEYPLFSNSSSVRFIERNVGETLGTLYAVISSLGKDFLVQYRLIKDGDKWKIASIVLEDASEANRKSAIDQDRSYVIPVESQIQFIQERAFEKAYKETVSKEYAEKMSEDDFENYIKAHPIVMQFTAAHYDKMSSKDNSGEVSVILESAQGNATLNYSIIKENGQWKINDLKITDGSSTSQEAPFDETPLRDAIKAEFDLIKQKDYKTAYDKYTSKQFKKDTSYKQFEEFVKDHSPFYDNKSIDFGHLTFDNNTAILSAKVTSSTGENHFLVFNLVQEEGQWKILFIQIKEKEPHVKRKSGSEPMKFVSFVVGTQINAKGVVQNPSSSIPSSASDIYLNLNVANGFPNTRVDVSLQHMETKSKIAPVSARIANGGDSTLSLIFSPPVHGWPKGAYRIEAESSTGVHSTYDFTVN